MPRAGRLFSLAKASDACRTRAVCDRIWQSVPRGGRDASRPYQVGRSLRTSANRTNIEWQCGRAEGYRHNKTLLPWRCVNGDCCSQVAAAVVSWGENRFLRRRLVQTSAHRQSSRRQHSELWPSGKRLIQPGRVLPFGQAASPGGIRRVLCSGALGLHNVASLSRGHSSQNWPRQ